MVSRHVDHPSVNLLGPGEVHQPSYAGELPEGVWAAGFDEGNRFPFAAWAATMIPFTVEP